MIKKIIKYFINVEHDFFKALCWERDISDSKSFFFFWGGGYIAYSFLEASFSLYS